MSSYFIRLADSSSTTSFLFQRSFPIHPSDPRTCSSAAPEPEQWPITVSLQLCQLQPLLQPRSQGLSSSRPSAGSERGETLVGAGHVSPREKVDPGRGPSPASLCQDLLSTPKRGLRFVARSPRETHLSGYVFQ